MADLNALIFDVDGTLAETERDGHRVAFNQAFQAAGLDWHWSVGLYGHLLQVAGGKERIRFYIDHYAPSLPNAADREALITELHQAKTHYYTALLQSGAVHLRPGVKRLLAEAHQQGVQLAIATTSRRESAITLLETAIAPEAPNWFEVIAAGDIVPQKKPAPDIYHYVLDKLDLPACQCLAFEDSAHGLAAATQAALKTVVTVNDYTRNQSFPTAVMVLNHLGDVDRPFEILAGPRYASLYFTLALARSLL